MDAIATRKRNQPAPPHVVFDDLVEPERDAGRPWLHLLDDEVRPQVRLAERPSLVVWSSIWVKRPDAEVRFDLEPGDGGTDLRWTLLVERPAPDDRSFRHMCQRIGELINAGLRYSYGQ
ncbi:SRPBCC family protein [Williamsia deligens]|uniref:SRPBCC domain-containing protein n=1 Tax=Williamsia deligens TaxID=321325 RepID=A0ABW3G6C3_9NOCA|nr:hypothetical protein [Williamsia deligens]